MDPTLLLQIYIASAAIGSIVICASAMLGLHHGGGAGGHGHGLAAHGTHMAQHNIGHFAHSIGHGSSHGPAIGHGHAGIAGGHGQVGAHGAGSGGTGQNGQPTNIQSASSSFPVSKLRTTERIEKVLGYINPMMWSIFMTYLGLSGIVLLQTMPFLGVFTLVPAILFGLLVTRTTTNLMSLLFARLNSSSAVQPDDLIGRMAEVTVAIQPGRVGEIMYVSQMKRLASTARAENDTLAFHKGDKVMICDRSGAFLLVGPWTDSFIDPNFSSDRPIINSSSTAAREKSDIVIGGTEIESEHAETHTEQADPRS